MLGASSVDYRVEGCGAGHGNAPHPPQKGQEVAVDCGGVWSALLFLLLTPPHYDVTEEV